MLLASRLVLSKRRCAARFRKKIPARRVLKTDSAMPLNALCFCKTSAMHCNTRASLVNVRIFSRGSHRGYIS